MHTGSSVTEATTPEEAVPGKAGRPPPIILTSTTNPIQLQRQLKNVAKATLSSEIPKTEPESSLKV
jgi:hypothetical protein